MKIFIMEENEQQVTLYLRSEEENAIGEASFDILPGQEFYGLSFEDLRRMGVGQHSTE